MFAKDIMTGHAALCTPHTSLRDAAILMVDHECGCLPVAKDADAGSEIIGMITDRDLVGRVVVEGLDPIVSTVWLAMTTPAEIVYENATIEECVLRLRHRQVDHLVVVDRKGCCCGIITQGDIARQRVRPKPDDGTTQVPAEISTVIPAEKPPSAVRTYSRSGRLLPTRTSSNRLSKIRPISSGPPG